MRIRKHRVGFLLLLSALPHLSADDPASLLPDDAEGVVSVDPSEREHTALHDDVGATPHEQQQQQEEDESEPRTRPQHEQDTVDDPQQHKDEKTRTATSNEEEIITSDRLDSSSPAADSDSDTSDNETTNGETEESSSRQDETDEVDEESATEAVHEDGFRLPALSKTTNENHVAQPASVESPSSPEIDETSVEGQRDDDIVVDTNLDDDLADQVVVDQEDHALIGSTTTTTPTDSEEVDDEEVVVIKDAKLAIGTTSVDLEEDAGSDDLVMDESMDVELEDDENATEASSTDDTVSTDDTQNADASSEMVEEEITDSNASAIDQETSNDGDVESPGEGTEDKEEIKGETEDEDEDDEDLTDRISVDYASKAAGAQIIEKSSEFKGTSNLIHGNRDKYAIIPCSEEKKYVVLSLSEEILVEEIKLADYERFSSTTKDFQVKGSQNLQKWVDLGTYRAEPGNGEQTFRMENPAWANYLKFKFLTHHGIEHYCTLSQIKVHGKTLVQGFHEQWESIEEDNNDEQIGDDASENVTTQKSAGELEGATESKTKSPESTEKEEVAEGTETASTEPTPIKEESNVSKDKSGNNASEKVNTKPSAPRSSLSMTPRPPLADFRTPTYFSEVLTGQMEDEEKLFSNLFDMIPHTMSTLPAQSKNLLEESELRSVHQISKLAMESLYSFGSKIVDGFVEQDSGSIASPKMDDFADEYIEKKFGSGLASMINLNALSSTPTKRDPQQNESISDKGGNADPIHSTPDGREDKPVETSNTKETDDTTVATGKESLDDSNDPVNLAIARLLKDLPSAECLVNLDFTEFKQKISAARKSSGVAGGSQGGRAMEPIFKKLTDEIFALQTSLSVHDQFSKLSVGCYQRVLLDLAMQMETLRNNQEERLSRLEEQLLEPASWMMVLKLVVSEASSMCTWLVSMATALFFTTKNVWIPKLLKVILSRESYDGLFQVLRVVEDQANKLMGILCNLSTRLDTNDWAAFGAAQYAACQTVLPTLVKKETYHEFLSAWSTYYDGGMVMVATILTIFFCRTIMWCASFRKSRTKKVAVVTKEAPPRRRAHTGKKDPPQTAHSIANNTNAPVITTTDKSNVHLDDSKHVSFSHKNKNASHQNGSTEDEVPELEHETEINRRTLDPSSPSVVSLEG